VVIALLPRILVGVVPYFVYRFLVKALPQVKVRGAISLAVAGISGALTNTILVMSMIYFCFREEFAAAKQIAVEAVYDVILGIVAANGVPEAIVGAVLTMLVGGALLRVKRK